jgi:hypothetical protein
MDQHEKEAVRIVAYVMGGFLSVGSIISLTYLLEGVLGASIAAGTIGAVLVWLGSRTASTAPSGAKETPSTSGRRTFYTGDKTAEEFLKDNEGI